MDAKVMKEMLEGNSVQVKSVEVGDMNPNSPKTIPLDAPIKMIVVNGSLDSDKSEYSTTTLIKSGYFYLQNANRMYISITDSEITLNGLNFWFDVQVLLFY